MTELDLKHQSPNDAKPVLVDGFEKLARANGFKGKLFWKQRWFSICSAHFKYKEDCSACNAGIWTNIWKWKIGNFIFKVMPKFWIWWMNRPNIKARKQIEGWFPKLRSK